MEIICDRITYFYDFIPLEDFSRLYDKYQRKADILGFEEIELWIGKDIRKYHYNLKIGIGEGAIMVNYKHNTEKKNVRNNPMLKRSEEGYRMRLEYNPQKLTDDGKTFLFSLYKYLGTCNIHIRKMDLAIDLPISKEKVMIHSLSGRGENRYDGTRYYGKGNGRLKVYDKKKEREDAGYEVKEKELTRVEFSYQDDVGIELGNLGEPPNNISINKFYKISIINKIAGVNPEVMCYIKCILDGFIEAKELTRTNRNKVKEAMEEFEIVDMDKILNDSWKKITTMILDIIYGSH